MTSIVFGTGRTCDEDAHKLEATQRAPRQHHHTKHFKGPEVVRRRIGAGIHDDLQHNDADEQQRYAGKSAPNSLPTGQRPALGNNKTKRECSDEQHEGYDHIVIPP